MATNKNVILRYGGKLELVHYPDSHKLKLGDEHLPSVTSWTGKIDKSEVMKKWATDMMVAYLRLELENLPGNSITVDELLPMIEIARRNYVTVSDKAKDIGSKVHDWVERFGRAKMSGSPIPELPEIITEDDQLALNGISAFLDWFNSHDIKFLQLETMIVSRDKKYWGRFDALVEIDGKIALVDYKTSSGIFSESRYQISGYWQAYEEEFDTKIDLGIVVNFKKTDGSLATLEIGRDEHLVNVEVFNACGVIARREKDLRKEYEDSKK